MTEILLTLASDQPHPKAGRQFKVIVRLDQPAPRPMRITFEKHRVAVDTSGTHALCVIDVDRYFAPNGLPVPIDLTAGATSGAAFVTVREQAQSWPCPESIDPQPERVEFPDRLMLTAFVSA